MRILINTVGALVLALAGVSAQAAVFSDGIAEWDEENELLTLGATLESSEVPIEGFYFDWDGALRNFDFSDSELVSSDINGSFFTPVLGFFPGAIIISDLETSPMDAPVSFNFLLLVPGVGIDILSEPIDFRVCANCFETQRDGRIMSRSEDFITPVPRPPGSDVPAPPALALFLLALAALGLFRRPRVAQATNVYSRAF